MTWLLIPMVLLYTFQSLFCRLYTNARNGGGALQFSVFYGACAGLFTLAFNGFSYAPSTITLCIGLINALVLMTYNLSMLKCGNLGSYAFMMICVLAGGILMPMFYDAIFLGSPLTLPRIFAVVLMLAAFVLMNLDGLRGKKSGKFLLWCAILFVANGAYCILMNLQQELMQFTQRTEMIITTFLGTAVFTVIFGMLFQRKSFLSDFRMEKKAVLPMLLSAASATIAVNLLMVIISMDVINFTVLNVVDNGGVLVCSALAAFIVFKEKAKPSTLIGIALACVSIIILSL